MILVSAIRDFMYSSLGERQEAETITRLCLLSTQRRGIESPHLRLSADDHVFFESAILRNPADANRRAAEPDPKKESHNRLLDAAKLAASHVCKITDRLRPDAQYDLLHKWLDFIERSARVIWVEVSDQPTAYRIFETMNDRGLKLSAADLLKNFIYSTADSRQVEAVQRWQSMAAVLESLGPDDGDVVDYIRYFWITGHGHIRSMDLFTAIKKEVVSEQTAVSLASSLDKWAGAYAALLTPTHTKWATFHDEIRQTIDILRDLGVSQVRPLLLSAFDAFPDHELERLMKNAVNWSVRCLLAGVSSGNLEGHYNKNAKKIQDRVLRTVDEVATEMMAIIPQDDRFRLGVRAASVPTGSLARYYLRVLQRTADGVPEPQYVPNTGKDINLEHIMPRRLTTEWEHISPDQAKGLLNRLGNQALLVASTNAALGNASFETKRPHYLNSQFSLSSMIAELEVWGADQINERQEILADLAVEAWPLIV